MDGPAGGASSGDQLDAILQAVLAQIRESLTGAGKEFNVVQPTIGGAAVATTDGAADPKIWGFLAPVLAQAASTLIPMAVDAIQGKDLPPAIRRRSENSNSPTRRSGASWVRCWDRWRSRCCLWPSTPFRARTCRARTSWSRKERRRRRSTRKRWPTRRSGAFWPPVLAQGGFDADTDGRQRHLRQGLALGGPTAPSEQQLTDPKIWGVVGPMLMNVAEALLPVATSALQ